jgi:hypothetical protein
MLRRTHMRSHPRLPASVAVALTLYCILSRWIGTATAFLIAFDGGAVVFLAAVALATPEGMRRRAEIEARTLRREVLAHGVLAFFFNVVIVALTINIVAGLI